MCQTSSSRPSVLFIGGHDPSGGAGIQADIETAMAFDCRAYSLISSLTEQDSRNVVRVLPQSPDAFASQLHTLLNDVQADWLKIGLLGSGALTEIVVDRLNQKQIPTVLDPVLAAGGGKSLTSDAQKRRLVQGLVRHATLITPNRAEARQLTGRDDAHDAAAYLLDAGAAACLLTGADETEEGGMVRNTLFVQNAAPHHFDWPKLPDSYHGSGCTLAAACACLLAQGQSLVDAVEQAQSFTWRALEAAEKPGRGQALPNRTGQPSAAQRPID